jgi:hypothetical protein
MFAWNCLSYDIKDGVIGSGHPHKGQGTNERPGRLEVIKHHSAGLPSRSDGSLFISTKFVKSLGGLEGMMMESGRRLR